MAQTPSTMLALGTEMPSFNLPAASGTTFSSDELAGKPTVVVFMCNHCPFVVHVIDALAERALKHTNPDQQHRADRSRMTHEPTRLVDASQCRVEPLPIDPSHMAVTGSVT